MVNPIQILGDGMMFVPKLLCMDNKCMFLKFRLQFTELPSVSVFAKIFFVEEYAQVF